MYFDFETFWRMFRLAFRDPMSRRRRFVVSTLLVAIPVWAAVNAVCLLLDSLLFPGWRRVRVRAPIFVVGHARSGTTLTHTLMTRDENLSYFMTYELFLPSIVQKKLVRLLAAGDRRLLDSRIARAITAWEDRAFARGRQMHPMSLTGPEEDDFVLALSCATSVWVTLFPYMRELDHLYYLDELPAAKRRRVMSFYRDCVKRQLYVNGADRIHCSKNPTFSGRVESLLDIFPDARFVVLMRSPLETIPSLLKMMQRNWRASDCDPERMQDSLQCLAEQSFHTYRYPLETLARHPETRWTSVDYRELVAEPKRVVESIYEKLELPISDAFRETLVAEEQRSKDHRAEHVYDLDEFGLKRDEIRSRMADLFERFSWETSPPRTARI